VKSTSGASLMCGALLFACAAAYSADPYSADGSKGDMQRAPAVHPDFKTVDTQRHGYLTSDDVRNDDYVSKNFAKCNLTHDGHMTREEYANCHE